MSDKYSAMKSCPKFNTCSAPKCPLDPQMYKRHAEPSDPKCTLPKAIRIKLGKNLNSKGLFRKEITGKEFWSKKS